jgi:hypothetical protein
MLPGGKTILVSIARGTGTNRWDAGQIVAQELGSSERKTLINGGSEARYVPTGHIVYAVGGILMAVPFDASRVEVRGEPVPVVEGVRRTLLVATSVQVAHFSFSTSGSLAYLAGPISVSTEQADLALIDRHGTTEALKLPRMAYHAPRVSHDGRFIAVGSDDGKEATIWIHDLSGNAALRQLTFSGKDRHPVWSSDGVWVAFQSGREGDLGIFRQRADGTGAPERLTKPENGTSHVPYAWSPNGDVLLYSVEKDRRFTLWSLRVTDRHASAFAGIESAIPSEAVFSPDGRWIAYQAGTVGDPQIYLQPLSGGAKYMVPRDQRNHHPLWSSAGELFYIPRQGVTFAIGINLGPPFSFGRPSPIQRGPRVEGPATIRRNNDLMPDGKYFVGVIPGPESSLPRGSISEIQIVLNWFDDLKARVPVR